MSIEKKGKINQLLRQWPDGLVMTSSWLVAHGYSFQLIKKYVSAGWINKIGQGAHTKLNDTLNWPGSLCALQQQLKLPVHVGGITALEIHGLAQYLSLESTAASTVNIYNTTVYKKALPKWFMQSFKNCIYRQHKLFKSEIGLEEKKVQGMNIIMASPERAILELLALVPYDFDYHHAFELSENLQLLRPDIMQQLLTQCLSIKVKRLFLYFADTHQLPCFGHINTKTIDLGKGKRMIEPGGHYIADYQLAVPKNTDELEIGVDDV